MTYYDAHNHLQDKGLRPHLSSVLKCLEELPVASCVVNGTIDSDWPAVTELSRDHSWIIPSYGIHPWRVKERVGDWEARLCSCLDQGGVIGEIGLDRWKEGYDFPEQESVFRAQLRLAARRNIPATIHCLRAWGALWEIIRNEPIPERGFLLHAYGGPIEMIEAFASRGAYFSFNGYFLAEARHRKREAFLHVPLDRLLVETDSPAMPLPSDLIRYHLASTPEGDVINHPANIVATYQGLAQLRGTSLEEMASQIAANFNRLFRL